MREAHEFPPCGRGQATARGTRLAAVIIAKPHARDQPCRITDKPGITRTLGRTRFPTCRMPEGGTPAAAIVKRPSHHGIHHADNLSACHPRKRTLLERMNEFAFCSGHR